MSGYGLYREWLKDHDLEYVEREVNICQARAAECTSDRSRGAWTSMMFIAEQVAKGKQVKVRA